MFKKMVAVLFAMFVVALPASAQTLTVFDFEDGDIQSMVSNGDITVNGMIELKLSPNNSGQELNIHVLPTTEDAGKRNILMNVPIYGRDMSLKRGVCFEVNVPEYEERPRYIEFNLQFDMPGRAQTVAGQQIFYTDENNVTTDGQVQSGNVIRLDSGFKGKVYVPFAAFQSTAGSKITSAQIHRMYMIIDCDLFRNYAFGIDNIGFYAAEDLPAAAEETPPDFMQTNPDKTGGGTTSQVTSQDSIPGTQTITKRTDPDYKIITRILSVLEWFDYLLIGLGAAVLIGFTVWLILFLKKRKKKKLNAASMNEIISPPDGE